MKKICMVLALLYAPVAGAEYKCVDARGLTHVGDTPPAGCADVVMYEISPTGRVLRRIDPTPNAEQLKLRLEEADRRKEAEKAAGEQKRRDLALLNTYSNEREVDVARDRNIEPLRGRIKSAQDRLAVVAKREKQVEEELEFYKAGKAQAGKGRDDATRREAPPALVQEMERIKSEKEGLARTIAANEKEIEQLRSKYEGDKQRWLALKTGVVAKPAEYIPADPPKPDPRRRFYNY